MNADPERRRLLLGAAGLARLSGVPVVLFGGLARGLYTSPRTTEDADVLYAAADLGPVAALRPTMACCADPRRRRACAEPA